MTMTSTRVAAAAVFLLAATGVSHAETMKVTANLKPSAEVPPVTSSKGSGMLTGTYDPTTKKLTYDVTYSGLTGPAVAVHFHAPAPAGKNSGIEIPLKGDLKSPIKGTKTLDATEAKNLTDGMTYFNIHTAKNASGELRGQVMVEK